jgi:gliding motility-associated-like protein/uncharacterized repeat protein (TIGR01451 family)
VCSSDLQPGENVSVVVTALVTALEGSIVNRVLVTGDNFDDQEDDADPISLKRVDVQVLKEVSATTIAVGARFQYRIRITNNSETTATGVEVSDFLPDGVRFIDVIPQSGSATYDVSLRLLTWKINELAPNQSLLLEVEVLAETAGNKSNTATVESKEFDIDELNNTSTVSHIQLDFNIPNVFTPNGDGMNDTWEITGIQEFFTSNRLLIVNRWGIEVFKTENYANEWDGGNLNEGTYFYQLTGVRLDGKEEVFKGYVTIIK